MWKLKKLKPRPGWNEKMDSFPCPFSLSALSSQQHLYAGGRVGN